MIFIEGRGPSLRRSDRGTSARARVSQCPVHARFRKVWEMNEPGTSVFGTSSEADRTRACGKVRRNVGNLPISRRGRSALTGCGLHASPLLAKNARNGALTLIG